MTDPTREQRMAAIEPVVSEYTWLLSAAHYTLFGAAPWRAHAEQAFLLHYRNMDDFLLGATERDEILAGHFLAPEQVRPWDLPTWRAEFRGPVRSRLDHLGYHRLTESAWVPHKSLPRLDAEIREAWRQFYDAITDAEYRREFVRQVELRRRELTPFHVRVELLYV